MASTFEKPNQISGFFNNPSAKNQSSGFAFKGVGASGNQGFSSGGIAKVSQENGNMNTFVSANTRSDPFKSQNLEPESRCGPVDYIYSELSELDEDQKKHFNAANFQLFSIPANPPPKELC